MSFLFNKKFPIPFDEISLFKASHTPNTLIYSSEAYFYFFRSLYDRLWSRWEVTLPEDWNKEYFMFTILLNGHVEVFNTPKYGTICQCGSLHGVGLYYQPTRVNVVHANLFKYNMKIGKDCEIIKIEPDYRGVFDILDFYAKKLATLDGTINQSIINTRLAYIFGAKTKGASELIKHAMERVQAGEPTVVIDALNKNDMALKGDEPFSFVDFKVSQNYITDKLLNDYRSIYNQFDTEIGLPNVQTEKKERLISDEVNANNIETVTRFETWTEELQESIKRVKKLFPDLELDIKPRAYSNPVNIEGSEVDNGTDETND